MRHDDELTEDPCRAEDPVSGERALAFVLLFIVLFGGATFVMFSESSFGTLLATVLSYTSSVLIYGFARNKNGVPRYLFSCPVVMSQYPLLLKRHAVFLAVLIAFVIVALRIRPHSSRWMETPRGGGAIPFCFFVAIPIMVLALREIMTNRAVLERAHNVRFGEPPSSDGPGKTETISLFGSDQ